MNQDFRKVSPLKNHTQKESQEIKHRILDLQHHKLSDQINENKLKLS